MREDFGLVSYCAPVELCTRPGRGMSQLVQSCCGFPSRWPVHGQRSLNRVRTVARSGNKTHLSTRRGRVPASFGSSWPGGSNKLAGARPFGMPFKRLTLLWLAGAIAMSAAVSQGALANVREV